MRTSQQQRPRLQRQQASIGRSPAANGNESSTESIKAPAVALCGPWAFAPVTVLASALCAGDRATGSPGCACVRSYARRRGRSHPGKLFPA